MGWKAALFSGITIYAGKALRRLTKGRTCIPIVHRLSTVTDAERIVVLEKGKVIEIGFHNSWINGGFITVCSRVCARRRRWLTD